MLDCVSNKRYGSKDKGLKNAALEEARLNPRPIAVLNGGGILEKGGDVLGGSVCVVNGLDAKREDASGDASKDDLIANQGGNLEVASRPDNECACNPSEV
jgi:hypothetical protein